MGFAGRISTIECYLTRSNVVKTDGPEWEKGWRRESRMANRKAPSIVVLLCLCAGIRLYNCITMPFTNFYRINIVTYRDCMGEARLCILNLCLLSFHIVWTTISGLHFVSPRIVYINSTKNFPAVKDRVSMVLMTTKWQAPTNIWSASLLLKWSERTLWK